MVHPKMPFQRLNWSFSRKQCCLRKRANALYGSMDIMVEPQNPSHSSGNASENAFAFSVDEVCVLAGICKQNVYNALNDGRLRAKKIGTRTLILPSDLMRFLESLEDYSPKEKEECR